MKLNIIGYALSLSIGVVGGYLYSRKKYAKMAEEEIKSIRELYSNRGDDTDVQNSSSEPQNESSEDTKIKPAKVSINKDILKQDLSTYHDYASQYGQQDSEHRDFPLPNDTESRRAYVIDEQHFIQSVYEPRTLILYADSVVADDDDNELSEEEIIEYIGGRSNLSQLRNYPDIGCVYIRNDYLKLDYEVLASEKEFKLVKRNFQGPDDVHPIDE